MAILKPDTEPDGPAAEKNERNDRSAMTRNLTYEQNIRINSAYVHAGARLRTSFLMRFLSEAALAHLTELGAGRAETLDRGLNWVIFRQKIEISAWPELGENVVLRTRPAAAVRTLFPRVFEIAPADRPDDPVIRAETLWVLMDGKTRSMADPAAYGIRIPGAEGVPAPRILGAVRAPEGAAAVSETRHTVKFSQTDVNGHLGHVFYFDIIDDLLFGEGSPEASESESAGLLSGTFPRLIEAEYLNELRPGSEFVILHTVSGEDPGHVPGGRAHFFEARFAESGMPAFRILMR